MTLQFRREVRSTVFRDPRQNFQQSEVLTEVRYDPVTGDLTRVFPFRQFRLEQHDWSRAVEESRKRVCPFCPEAIESITPLFPEELVPGGRLRHGDAIVIPNISPYAAYAGVAVMTSQHYVPLTEISSTVINDGMTAAMSFLRAVRAYDQENGRYASIGWNYMPFSGGSIIHPHIQALAGPEPANYHRSLMDGSVNYYRQNGSNCWAELLASEQKSGERYLWQGRSTHWLATFAPKGLADITVLFPGKATVDDLAPEDIIDFAEGCLRVFRYYDKINLPSFNLALYPAPEQLPGYWLTARIVGRYNMFGWTSDINSLQMLLGDYYSTTFPEELAQDMRR